MINIPNSLKPSVPPTNIFKKPIAVPRPLEEKAVMQALRQNKQKAYTYISIGAVLLAIYSFVFLYGQAVAFIHGPKTIEKLEDQIKIFKEVKLPELEQSRDLKKAAYNSELGTKEGNIDITFPEDSDKLGIVRLLENFSTAIDAKNPPFEFNSITFGNPEQKGEYTVLPISTSIKSSKKNFDRFVELVNLSGKTDSEIPIRLMEISNVSIRYQGVDSRTGEDKGVSFSVKLNAYSRAES